MNEGFGAVRLPNALDSKYPSGSKELKWQWHFPQKNCWKNELIGQEGRWHVDESLTIQELLGHSDVSTTMIYTHVLNREAGGVVSPLKMIYNKKISKNCKAFTMDTEKLCYVDARTGVLRSKYE